METTIVRRIRGKKEELSTYLHSSGALVTGIVISQSEENVLGSWEVVIGKEIDWLMAGLAVREVDMLTICLVCEWMKCGRR